MESIFGITGKDFVILGADSKVARSILVYKDDEDKMQALDSHKLLCGSGPQSDRVEFCEYVQKNVKYYQLCHGVSLDGHAAAHFVRNELARRLRKAPVQLNLLLAACDVEKHASTASTTAGDDEKAIPSLYWMDYFGAMSKVKYGAQGYGAHFCLSIFDREYEDNLSLAKAKKILKMCDHELQERFLVKSGKWIYKMITKNGIETIEL